MPLGFVIWLVLGVVVGLVWAIRLVVAGPILRKRAILRSSSYDAAPNPAPRVSVLVAAKDEEDNIETCISTLLEQDYPDFEIIAIDDRSTDGTSEILRGMAQRAGEKLQVVTVTQLRAGWFGKNNAMRAGVSVASGKWLCFTDADCRQISSKTLTVAMRKVLEEEIDFLSITPVLDFKFAWERLTQPVCALVLLFRFLPNHVNKPKNKTAYANGAFMLINRRCYEAIGGHERVRTEVNEDIVMARIAKETGFGLHVAENETRSTIYACSFDGNICCGGGFDGRSSGGQWSHCLREMALEAFSGTDSNCIPKAVGAPPWPIHRV
ncbi:MAG: glycosyltransferase [Planctomycetes bacterium]|nr:glycosyltransferase [Planctomycetota bacterium]